jgi:hypothetical protein
VRTAILIFVALVVWGPLRVQKKARVEPPIIKAFTSSAETINHCPFAACDNIGRRLDLNTTVADAEKGQLTYTYAVTAGRIEGAGAAVIWDLEDALIGQHTATVLVKNKKGARATAALTVRIVACSSCDAPEVFIRECPAVVVECPAEIESGKLISFVVKITGGKSYRSVSYSWRTDAGRIVEGEFEKKMTLDLLRFPFEKVTATVGVGGFDPACVTSASCTTLIKE